MKLSFRTFAAMALLALCLSALAAPGGAQNSAAGVSQTGGAVVLSDAELARVVPPGFYFEGQSAPTQMRNAAAARFGKTQHVIAGLVDTTGYSSEIRAKYEGFLITDEAVNVGTGSLGAGAYGFGFTSTGQFNVFDVGGKPVMSVPATNDAAQTRPRPLMMIVGRDGLRLYGGRQYVVIGARPAEPEL